VRPARPRDNGNVDASLALELRGLPKTWRGTSEKAATAVRGAAVKTAASDLRLDGFSIHYDRWVTREKLYDRFRAAQTKAHRQRIGLGAHRVSMCSLRSAQVHQTRHTHVIRKGSSLTQSSTEEAVEFGAFSCRGMMVISPPFSNGKFDMVVPLQSCSCPLHS